MGAVIIGSCMSGRLGMIIDLELGDGALSLGGATSVIGIASVFAFDFALGIVVVLLMLQAVSDVDDGCKFLIIKAGATD